MIFCKNIKNVTLLLYKKVIFLTQTSHHSKKVNILFSQYLRICQCIHIHRKRKVILIFCIQIHFFLKLKMNNEYKNTIKPVFWW